MAFKTIRQLTGSVFTKLLVIFFLVFAAIIIVVGGAFRHAVRDIPNAPMRQNVLQYVRYILQDLGPSPSLERAKRIADKTSLAIGYESPGNTWSTSNLGRLPDNRHMKTWQTEPLIRGGIRDGKLAVVVSEGTGRYTFLVPAGLPSRRSEWLTFLILSLAASGVVMYLAIRHILKPLRFLSEGVRQITDGRLDYQVSRRGSTEFGTLADAFNTMTGRIHTMLKAKEQLLLDVSHELRSPLTRMKIALEMMPPGQLRDNMKDDVQEIELMIAEMLEEARLRHSAGELRWEAIAVEPLLSELEAAYRDRAPGIRIDYVPGDAAIKGDPVYVKIVLNNVITNAIKYSPADGEPVRIAWKQTDAETVIEVRDRGRGIPAEDLPHIFEPFYRVDKSRSRRTGGYGLGLSLCKTIMEAHQGRIEAESVPGAGTTITLHFSERKIS